MEKSENSRNSVQPQGKIVTGIFSSSSRYLCKTAVDWVNKVSWISDMVRVWWWPVILLELMWNDPWRSLLHLLFVVITYGKVSLWLRKSLENSEFFSPTLWPPCRAVGQNEVPFGRDTCVVPSNIVLNRYQSPTGRGDLGIKPPVCSSATYRQIPFLLFSFGVLNCVCVLAE